MILGDSKLSCDIGSNTDMCNKVQTRWVKFSAAKTMSEV
jgi:hypothetical protein